MDELSLSESTQLYFGRGKELETGRLVKFYGGSRVLILYSEEAYKIKGLANKIKRSLEQSGLDFIECANVSKNPRLSVIEDGIAACEKIDADFILAVGNGYCFSAAKSISVGVYHPTQLKEMFKKDFQIDKALPIGAIVTVPGCGFVASGQMSMTLVNSQGTLDFFVRESDKLKPQFAILNPELLNFSRRQLCESIINILARVIERYLAPKVASELSDRICESIISTLVSMWYRLKDMPGDYEAYANIMWSGIMLNAQIFSNLPDNPVLEKVKRGVGSLYDCSRTEALSLILPAFLQMDMVASPNRLAQLGNRCFGVELDFQHPENTAYRTLEIIRKFIKSSGLPQCFEDLGGSPSDLPRLVDLILKQSQFDDNVQENENGDRVTQMITPKVRFDRTGVEILLSLILMENKGCV